MDPVYTYGQNAGQRVNPGDGQTLLLVEIISRLQGVQDAVQGDASEGVQRTIQSTAPTSGGSVTAGAKSVSFVTSSDFVGTINGAAFPASAAKSFSVPSPADTLPAIVYTISAGTLYIDKIL